MEISALKAFLASQEAALETFLRECTDLDFYEIHTELSKHAEQLHNTLSSTCPRPGRFPKDTSATATPIKKSTLGKMTVPTHTSTGRALKFNGASTVFRTSSTTTKRRAEPDSDSSPEAAEVNTVPNDESPARSSSKRRLFSGAQIGNKTTDNTVDTGADNAQDKPAQPKAPARYQGTSRSGTGQKIRMRHPFISK